MRFTAVGIGLSLAVGVLLCTPWRSLGAAAPPRIGVFSLREEDALAVFAGEEIRDDDRYSVVKGAVIRFVGAGGCTGVAVRQDWILTAAHCVVVKKPEGPFVLDAPDTVIGTAGESLTLPQATCVHPRYPDEFSTGTAFDSALVPLSSLAMKTVVRNLAETQPTANDKVVLVGWGITGCSSGIPAEPLRSTTMPIRDRMTCHDKHKNTPNILGAEEFCAGADGSSACPGDSGAPLFLDQAGQPGPLVGIASADGPGASCCVSPWDIYTQVDRKWIEQVTMAPANAPAHKNPALCKQFSAP